MSDSTNPIEITHPNNRRTLSAARAKSRKVMDRGKVPDHPPIKTPCRRFRGLDLSNTK